MSSVKNHTTAWEADAKGSEKNRVMGGTLYLVATPIGNLADLSERAVKVLSEVDFIAAEDTRNTMHLLTYLGIQKPMVSYFEHNKRARGEEILARISSGESCALVTDAGMPAVSDPGADLVALCAERGISVSCVPGACAVVTALALSALPTGRFCFEGFLSTDKTSRKRHLASLAQEQRTMIFYEAPHKLVSTLRNLCEVFGGDRRISLCRELTKLNEEILRMTLAQALDYYAERQPRGEYVLVLAGKDGKTGTEDAFWQQMSVPEHVAYYMEQGMEKKEAIKAAAKDRGVQKNEIYQQVL